MNKQEKEQFISFINEAKEDLSFDFGEYHRTHRGYVLGTKVIGYIKHLYEQQKVKARLAKYWDEDLGDCLWWDFPVEEPPYCGTPLDDDFPKYKTHFTELHIPDEVEEEPKYYIQLPETTWGTYLVKGEDNELFVWQNATCGTKFTEQEIKSIDERYWPFAVPVEKV